MNRTIKVQNIPPGISNEYLMEAFSKFGDVRESFVFPNGDGKVIYKDEIGARQCLKLLDDHCFFLGSSMIPLTATMEVLDTIGIPEKSFLDSDPIVQKERSIKPYFASTPTQLRFEREWKRHFLSEKEAKQNFDRLILEERDNTVKSQMKQVTEDAIRQHDAMVENLKKKLEEYGN